MDCSSSRRSGADAIPGDLVVLPEKYQRFIQEFGMVLHSLLNLWRRLRPSLHWVDLKGLWWLWLGSGAIGGYALAFGTLWLIALLYPPVTWLGVVRAIHTFVPADLRHDFEEATAQEQEVNKQMENMTKEMAGKFQSPELDYLTKQLHDLVIK